MSKYKKIGKALYNIDDRLLTREPTKSNLLETVGSDNDFYFGNISDHEIVEVVCRIFEIDDISKFNGKKFSMDFYNSTVNVLANINNQGRINIRILGRERLYGMIKYYNGYYNKNIDINNLFVQFDFYNHTIKILTKSDVE